MCAAFITLFASCNHVTPVGEVEDMGFACQRHAILITPHQRNEVERSVGQ